MHLSKGFSFCVICGEIAGLEIWEYGRRDPSRWPRRALYPQKLSLTSPTYGGRSVYIVRWRIQATEFFYEVGKTITNAVKERYDWWLSRSVFYYGNNVFSASTCSFRRGVPPFPSIDTHSDGNITAGQALAVQYLTLGYCVHYSLVRHFVLHTAALWPWELTQPLTEISTRNSP
jgi:hypothetical protein